MSFVTNNNYKIVSFQKIKIENIPSSSSQASSREITNNNFNKISTSLNKISESLNDSILMPTPENPNGNYDYIIRFDGNNFFVEQVSYNTDIGSSAGVKFHLRSGDDIVVKQDYQYIVYNDLVIDPGANFTLETGAELVIL